MVRNQRPSGGYQAPRQPPAAVNARPHAPVHLQLETPQVQQTHPRRLWGVEKASLLQTAAHQQVDGNEFKSGETGQISTTQQLCARQRIISGAHRGKREPDGRQGLHSSGLVASIYMDPLPGRWGTVSFASLGLLSFLSNRGEPAASWADHPVALTRPAISAGDGTADLGPQPCRRVQRMTSEHRAQPAVRRAQTSPRPAQDTAVSRASRRRKTSAGVRPHRGSIGPITDHSADGGKSSATS